MKNIPKSITERKILFLEHIVYNWITVITYFSRNITLMIVQYEHMLENTLFPQDKYKTMYMYPNKKYVK